MNNCIKVGSGWGGGGCSKELQPPPPPPVVWSCVQFYCLPGKICLLELIYIWTQDFLNQLINRTFQYSLLVPRPLPSKPSASAPRVGQHFSLTRKEDFSHLHSDRGKLNRWVTTASYLDLNRKSYRSNEYWTYSIDFRIFMERQSNFIFKRNDSKEKHLTRTWSSNLANQTVCLFVCFFFFRPSRLVGMISGIESNRIKESESLKVLRAVRVLRPLKIVSGIPSEFTFVWNLKMLYLPDLLVCVSGWEHISSLRGY